MDNHIICDPAKRYAIPAPPEGFAGNGRGVVDFDNLLVESSLGAMAESELDNYVTCDICSYRAPKADTVKLDGETVCEGCYWERDLNTA